MIEPRLRKRFQIHLSTAIVMMFVAGSIMWLNVRGRPSSKIFLDYYYRQCTVLEYGWPFGIIEEYPYQFQHVPTAPQPPADQVPMYAINNLWFLALNLLVLAAILAAVWLLCEWLIRRRAKGKV